VSWRCSKLEGRPPRQLTLLQEDVAAVFHVRYSLEPDGGGTRFTQVSEFAWKRLPRVLHGMFERAVRREVRGQLRTLKALLERDRPHKGAAGAERDGATPAAIGPGLD
jgi:Polyketide cyclase / dehydrase and lipid transport